MGRALEEFDAQLPALLDVLDDGDMVLLTADHGNDPTDRSTDHSREFVPLLSSVKGGARGVDLGTRPTFADAAMTVADYFSLTRKGELRGNSFLQLMV